MIVPQYWAEAKRKIRHDDRAMTVRRFGWSDTGPAEAQQHAETRLAEALEQIASDEPTLLREPKVPYNGADGLPIREQIISRSGDAVVTRNAYGALCLNTPDVLFADVDALDDGGCSAYGFSWLVFTAAYLAMAWESEHARSIWLFLLGSIAAVTVLGSAWHWSLNRIRVSPKQAARTRIERFSKRNRDWAMRLYETPRGWRVLVTHATFDPRSTQVRSFFDAIGTDPIYARMCFNQNCFRARVSPKPWRVGVADHLTPRPGVWPVSPERMPDRMKWVKRYERHCQGFAACRFEVILGAATNCEKAVEIIRLHDQLSEATSGQPIA